MEAGGYIYIMTNRNNTVLYTGVTNDLARRKAEHAAGQGSSFTSKYNCSKLVYFEFFPDINQAILREKQLKSWKRAWKVALIEKSNPDWADLDVTGRPVTVWIRPSSGESGPALPRNLCTYLVNSWQDKCKDF